MMKKPKLLLLAISFFLILAVLWVTLNPFKKMGERFRIICMGDSLTESKFGYYPKHLYGLIKRHGIQADVLSAAKPGYTSGEYLDDLYHSEVLKNFSPDIVIIMLGTNDVRIDRDYTSLPRFKQNMQGIIRLIKKKGSLNNSIPEIFLVTIPPIFRVDLQTFDGSSIRRISEEIVPAIKELAREEDIHIIDVHDFFLSKPELMSGVHPWKKGFYAMAEYIFKSMIPILEKE